MAIGSKVIGKAVVAGQYGIIQAETGLVGLSQTVQLVDPAKTLATVEQSVEKIDRARQLVSFTQRVVEDIQDVYVPAAYVQLNGITLTCDTSYDNIVVAHTEGQQSTATLSVTYPTGSSINIPSFHGKSVRILVHEDPDDIESKLVPIFTGCIERAKHSLTKQAIDFTCTDLRDERLGKEDPQYIKQLTNASYSTITQRDGVSGLEYITELMKTVTGSLGYTRSGDLRYHSWGVGGKPVDLAMIGDLEYDSLETEFQTRSSVINSVTVDMGYRWQALRSIYTEVDAYKGRTWEQNGSFIDYKAWLRSNLLTQIQNFNPWQTLSYTFYPLERVQAPIGAGFIVQDQLWPLKELWSQGFTANLVRHISQPVSEKYTFKVVAPQSVDAYGTEVPGSSFTFATEVEYERSDWEQDFIENELANPTTAKSLEQSKADSLRQELTNGFNCAYAIAKKEIISSHRNSYVTSDSKRILLTDIGDIVSYDNQIVNTTGQLVGLTYSLSGSGDVMTSLKVAISYMDTTVPAPVENWAVPTAPAAPEADTTLITIAKYDTDDKAFDIKLPDISEQITDEYAPTIAPLSFDLPLEINPITLINGY